MVAEAGVDELFTPASWAQGLTAVGFVAASLALIRMRDDEFGLPPLRAAPR